MWVAPESNKVTSKHLQQCANVVLRTEVDVSLAGMSASNPGISGNGTALLEGNELVEVVEIGEHLQQTAS